MSFQRDPYHHRSRRMFFVGTWSANILDSKYWQLGEDSTLSDNIGNFWFIIFGCGDRMCAYRRGCWFRNMLYRQHVRQHGAN